MNDSGEGPNFQQQVEILKQQLGQAQRLTASFAQATRLTGRFGTVAPEGVAREIALDFAPYEAKVFELGK